MNNFRNNDDDEMIDDCYRLNTNPDDKHISSFKQSWIFTEDKRKINLLEIN